MDSKSHQRDDQEELRATSANNVAEESSQEQLSAAEEQRILAAMASIDAGRGHAFEDVFRELEDFGDA